MDNAKKPSESTESPEKDTLENARSSYQTAIGLWTYQGSLNWSRFNIMLAANSIIISAISLTIQEVADHKALPVLAILLPIIGLILCVVWICFASRGFDYHEYWSSRTRELEEKFLIETPQVVSQAKSVQEGGRIEFGPLSKFGGQKQVTYLVIAMFALGFVVALGWMIPQLV